jgi:hypothetical protein
MDEILPGVWHWTAQHPRIGARVSSYFLEDAATALDPLLPEGGADAFGDWPVQRVVLTCRHHLRDAGRLHEAFGSTIHAARAGMHEFEGAEVPVQPFDPGEEIAAGVRVHDLGAICPDDVVLHVHAGLGALAFGDGVVSHGGRPAFVPDHLMDEPEQVKARTFERLRELLELDFDALLFAHGDPIPTGGRDALIEFIRSADG